MAELEGAQMKKLDTKVSAAIRRGQIITKLSDVVRELVDNAVDAGPTRIQVYLDNFGLDKIEVRDDGHGIGPSQFGLAVKGGYTSKLNDEQNLSCGEDYGFRGEALSSICSFASVSILTRTEKDAYGTRYILDEMGKVKGENKAALARGTNVLVRDLFLKYPVRRNYIREKSRMVAELKEIEFYLKAIGLANHKISVFLIHNGSSIWTKPAVTSLNQAICSVLGVGVSKQLTICGPITISTPGAKNNNDLVTEIELHVPRVPIDTKLMITSSNKSVTIIVNRRRVHMREFERMLHQYIMGAIPSATQTTHAKHPVTVLKIVTPPDQADFNRDMNKSNVFLMYKVEILEKVEELLKGLYLVELNLINAKENIPNALTKPSSVRVINASDPSPSTLKASVDARNQNIASFLSDIPTSSNFSKSPVKTSPFQRGSFNSPPSPSSTAPEALLKAGFPAIHIERPGSRPAVAMNPSAVSTPRPATDIVFDRDWLLGRMKDQHGNIIEATTVVRGKAAFGGTTPTSRTPEVPRVFPATPTGDSMNSANVSYRDSTLYPPTEGPAKGKADDDLLFRLRNCHTMASGSQSSLHEYPRYEQPPTKRSRPNGIYSQSLDENDEDIFPRRSSQAPRAPRQVTLDSLRNWKLPGSTFTRTNSIQSTPVPVRRNSISEDGCSGNSQLPRDFIEQAFTPIMPQPAPKAVLNTPAIAVKSPSLEDSTLHLRRSVASSAMFRDLALSDTPQMENRIELNKVIGILRGSQVYIVQLDNLLGAFSPWNMLEMIPTMKLKVGLPAGSTEKNFELSRECVKILISEFTELSYDDYSEELVKKIFNFLRDTDEIEEQEKV